MESVRPQNILDISFSFCFYFIFPFSHSQPVQWKTGDSRKRLKGCYVHISFYFITIPSPSLSAPVILAFLQFPKLATSNLHQAYCSYYFFYFQILFLFMLLNKWSFLKGLLSIYPPILLYHRNLHYQRVWFIIIC